MQSREKIEAVQRMQDYIREHASRGQISYTRMYREAGYSKRHTDRIFRELTGETPHSYVKKIRLSESALKLLDGRESVLEIALSSEYQSHEGFSRAFMGTFGVTPREYRKDHSPIPLFVQYPVKASYSHFYGEEKTKMEKESVICMVTPVFRPKRRLIFLRSKQATDYWTFCEEIGCQWEGLFNSIPEKLDTAALLELPAFLAPEGDSPVAAGVEVPEEYRARIPENCGIAELEPCEMLYFQSEPYQKEEDFGQAIGSVIRAAEKYDAERYGYAYAFDMAPKFNFGADPARGARLAIPVKKLK